MPINPTDQSPFARGLTQGLARHELVLGQNLAFEKRAGNGYLGRLPELLSELIAMRILLGGSAPWWCSAASAEMVARWSTQRVSWLRLVQARAGLLVISEALTDHAAYFEAVAPDDEIRDLIPAAYDGL